MDFNKVLKYFSSSILEDYPYSIIPESNNIYRFDVVRNYSYVTPVSLNTGIYFELLQGNLYNSSVVTQTFSFKLKNPNSISISSGSYYLNVYSIVGNSLSLISSHLVGTTVQNDTLVSISVTGQDVLFTLEINSLVLYTSEDFEKNLIPVDQRILAGVSHLNNTTLSYPVFQDFTLTSSFLGIDLSTRTIDSKIHSINAVGIDNIYLYYITSSNTIGALGNNKVITDYKFPRSYSFVAYDIRNKLSIKTILFSYFIYKNFRDIINFDFVIDESFLNSLPKLRNSYYESYTYNVNNYLNHTSNVSIKDIVLVLFLIKDIYYLLDLQARTVYDNLLNYLASFTPITNTSLQPLLPDYLLSNTEDQYSLSTNLMFLDILRFFNRTSEFNTLKNSIESNFLLPSPFLYEISSNSLYVTTTSDPLKLSIIKFFLPVFFPNQYTAILSDVNLNLTNLSVGAGTATIVPSYFSITENFNPIFTFNPVPSVEIIYKTRKTSSYEYIDFSDNLIIKYIEGSAGILDLFSPKDEIYLGANKFSTTYEHFILPEFFTSLLNVFFKYRPSLKSLYENLSGNSVTSSISLINYKVDYIGNNFNVYLELNSPSRIMYVIFDKINTSIVYYYYVSTTASPIHSFTINTTAYPINQNTMNSGILLLR
ncbi:MAG: hypothetical protein QXP88_00195 [Thermoproteota archaeon]